MLSRRVWGCPEDRLRETARCHRVSGLPRPLTGGEDGGLLCLRENGRKTATPEVLSTRPQEWPPVDVHHASSRRQGKIAPCCELNSAGVWVARDSGIGHRNTMGVHECMGTSKMDEGPAGDLLVKYDEFVIKLAIAECRQTCGRQEARLRGAVYTQTKKRAAERSKRRSS
jgi:hypothetical protein